MHRFLTLAIILTGIYTSGLCQDITYARQIINVLASDSMYGRGYQYEGDRRSAELIREEFRRHGLQFFDTGYYQQVVFPVNSIAGPTRCEVDGVLLEPGRDYYISARSKGIDKSYSLVWLDHKVLKSPRKARRFFSKDLSESLLVIDPRIVADGEMRDSYLLLFFGERPGGFKVGAAGVIRLMDKPGWQVSDSGREQDYVVLTMRTGTVTRKSRRLTLSFSNHFEKQYASNNVLAMIPGTIEPDSFIVFGAHYDHLGLMGEVMILGANDNASGTAMVLDLARHYAENPPAWSVAFIAFTAEEMGLLGSFHYVNNPLFPLEQIALMINLDMVGTGSDGITLVNGAVFREQFSVIDSLNTAYNFLPQVRARGESANSDHYPFYAKGVKSFFIYTMGDEFREYHNIYDRPEDLPLTRYEDLFRLLTTFADHLMN